MGTAMDGDGRDGRERGDDAMLAAARAYTRQGWRVVPVRPREKGVTLSGWQQLRLKKTDLRRWFGGTNPHNIGILTGAPSGGLVDVDCDAPEAALAAAVLLPPTGLISGRASSPASHYWYGIGAAEVINLGDMSTEILGDPTIPATEKFADVGALSRPSATLPDAGRDRATTAADGADGSGSPPSLGGWRARREPRSVRPARVAPAARRAGMGERAGAHHSHMLVELRSTGCQTIAPPSIHPSGEVVRWETDGVPWSVGGSQLRQAVAKVAAVALLARHWPGVGQRDEAAKDLAGLLLRGGWKEEEVDEFTRLVARIAGDEEWRQRGKARGTARKRAAGEPVTGGQALAQRLTGDGARVVAQARAWLHLNGLGSAQVSPATKGDHRATKGDQSGGMTAFEEDDRLKSVVARDVKQGQVDWLWRGRIPLGAITLLDGDPGLGKSLITIDLAARVSTGRTMPDGAPGVAGGAGVVLLSAEDQPSTTILPRLEVAAADLDRVQIVYGVDDYDPTSGRDLERLVRLPLDIQRLERFTQRTAARLVVIDPLMSYLDSTVNSWRDQDVRAALAPLAALAERTGAAVLILRHLNKATSMSALYRGGGSIGIIAAARSGLVVAKHPDDPDHDRVLASTKSNLGPPMPSLRYRLTPPLARVDGLEEDAIERLANVPAVEWLGECQLNATTLLVAPNGGVGTAQLQLTKRAEAGMWLRDALATGPQPVDALEEEAVAEGISLTTLRRASGDLDIVKEKRGYAGDGGWFWRLPKKPAALEADAAREVTATSLKDATSSKDDHAPRLTALDGDDRLSEHAPSCPMTGKPHNYGQFRSPHGPRRCLDCWLAEPDDDDEE